MNKATYFTIGVITGIIMSIIFYTVLLKNRSSATEPKVSFIAHCTQCYVTRQLSEYEQREMDMTRNFIAESVTRN